MSYIYPLSAAFPAGQRYGTNPGGVNPVGGHTGIDFPCPVGTILRAPGDGVIEFAGSFSTSTGADNPWLMTGGGGKTIVLNAGPGQPNFNMSHLSEMHVKKGQHVKKGDIIGKTGNSGWWTTGPHLHFEVMADGFNLRSSTYGRSNPANFCTGYWEGVQSPLAANQRRNGNYVVKQRSAPRTGDDVKVTREIQPNSTETFRGFVRGEMVDLTAQGGYKSDLWYEDQHGYCSIALFDPFTVDGLPDLTPKPASDPVLPHQRVTAADGAQGRFTADKNGDAVGKRFDADLILSFKGYVRAEVAPYADSTNIWFVGINGSYFWAGAFVDESTHDLADLTPSAVTSPSSPAPQPQVPAYTFNVDIAVINGINVELIPANSSNVEIGNFPDRPTTVVKHHWGTPPIPFTSPLGEWTREKSYKSIHFQIGLDRIAQCVSLKNRAYHAGPQGNMHVGFEIDPRGYERGADGQYTAVALKIQENVRAAHAAVNEFFGYELGHVLHKDVPGAATACSPFDLSTLAPVKVTAPAPVQPAPVVPEPVTPAPTQPVPTAPVVCEVTPDLTRKILDDFTDSLIDEYLNRDNK